MVDLAETRAKLTYLAAKTILEKAVPPVRLNVRPASLETARKREAEGNFQQAAVDYYSILRNSNPDLQLKKEAAISLPQHLINLGKFGQAEKFLDKAERFARRLEPEDGWFLRARIYEKRGWIADYQHGYAASDVYFSQVRSLLRAIYPQDRNSWPIAVQEVDSTATHFRGRAKFGLAEQDIKRDWNCARAIEFFSEAIKYDRGSNLKVGFGTGWLARCYNLLGDYRSADVMLEEMRRLFSQQLAKEPGRGLMAQVDVLAGCFQLERGDLDVAMDDFGHARWIRQTIEPYPKGLADADLGMAAVYIKRGQLSKAIPLVTEAVRVYPMSLFRGVIGS